MYHRLNGKVLNLQVRSSLFRSQFFSVTKSLFDGASGIGMANNPQLAARKSLSENMERENLYHSSHVDKLTTTTTFFENEMTFSRNPYYSLVFLKNNEFKDSSGVGAGPSSFMSIEHAFYEFVERQSIVYSFLMERPGEDLTYLITQDRSSFSTIPTGAVIIANDISITTNVSVVLLIIIHEGKFALGLGADKSQFQAAKKALNEALGYDGNMTADSTDYISFTEFIEQVEYEPDAYAQYMVRYFSSKKLLQAYDFLRLGNKITSWKQRSVFSITEDLFQTSSELKIPISIQFMPNYLHTNFIKTVYVYSEQGYPSINNLVIDPEVYDITQFENRKPIQRRVKQYLPFP